MYSRICKEFYEFEWKISFLLLFSIVMLEIEFLGEVAFEMKYMNIYFDNVQDIFMCN